MMNDGVDYVHSPIVVWQYIYLKNGKEDRTNLPTIEAFLELLPLVSLSSEALVASPTSLCIQARKMKKIRMTKVGDHATSIRLVLKRKRMKVQQLCQLKSMLVLSKAVTNRA